MKRIIGLISICLIFSSCSEKKANQVYGAPTESARVGVIATCATVAQAEEITLKYQGQFRVLNESKKLIEFIGITQEDLKNELPKSYFKANAIVENLAPRSQVSISSGSPEYVATATRAVRKNSHQYYFNFLTQIEAFNLPTNAQGDNSVIAIVDTGVSYNHIHLNPNILLNSGDSTVDGKDNDGNGFIDDQIGWDFVNHDRLPMDDNGHGTHVAGLAAGILSGVAPKAKILSIKVLDSEGTGDLGTIVAGILYATDKGAHVINLSLGGNAGDTLTNDVRNLISAVTRATGHGSLIVAASGNGGADGTGDCNDGTSFYPANIQDEMVVSVAAVDENNELAVYSNFGKTTVDIAAPGGSYTSGGLLSTAIPSCTVHCSELTDYVEKMGTSMSTPIVSGLAAALKSFRPNLSMKQIKDLIYNSGTLETSLLDKIMTGKIINGSNALSMASTL